MKVLSFKIFEKVLLGPIKKTNFQPHTDTKEKTQKLLHIISCLRFFHHSCKLMSHNESQ
jgi:hypothetical protein